jgi:hypothetical protein
LSPRKATAGVVPLRSAHDASSRTTLASVFNLPELEINRRYEEWMKIVADNVNDLWSNCDSCDEGGGSVDSPTGAYTSCMLRLLCMFIGGI